MPPEVNYGGHVIIASTASISTNQCNAILSSANVIDKTSTDINSIQRDLDNDTIWFKLGLCLGWNVRLIA